MIVRLRIRGEVVPVRFASALESTDPPRLTETAGHAPEDRLMWAANARVKSAVRRGLLLRLDGRVRCTDCPRPATEYDHRDYARPLDVEPVCRSCNHRRGPAAGVPRLPDHADRGERGRFRSTYAMDAIRRMAETGREERVPLGGRRGSTVAGALRMAARRHGLLFRYRLDGDSVIARVEAPLPLLH